MDTVEVVETGRKLSETTLGEWGMILTGVLVCVPVMATLFVMWLRARSKRDEYKRRLDESDVSVF